MIDYEILGEVLIPLENGNFLSNKSSINFQDLNKCNIKLFRKILFQGEFLKLYITLQSSKANIENLSSIFDDIYFNIEFESTEIDKKNTSINEEEKNSFSNENFIPSFSFYCPNKNLDEAQNINNYDFNKEFELVTRKEFDKESGTEVYEILKEIRVPQNFVNSNLLMKVNIYLYKYNIFLENKNDNENLNLYQLGILNNIEKYKHLKTIFKEVKVINALNILSLKQIEPKIDLNLLEAKINNYDDFDLVDNSLKFSKIFKNINSTEEPKLNENNKNIYIKDIRILKEETSFDENLTEYIDFIKEKLINEKNLINKDDFSIAMVNKSKYPYIINSGEEFNLLIKIIKNPYINESLVSSNKLNNANNNNKNKNATSIDLITQNETNAQNEVNKIIINIINDNNLKSTLLTGVRGSEENIGGEFMKFALKRNTIALSINKNLFPQKVQEPILSIGNIFKKKNNFSINDGISNEKILLDNESVPSNKDKKDDNKKVENIDNNNLDLDLYFDENFKIYYNTPVILDLACDLFYENINMCIQLKWSNEINRYLMLSIIIPEHININQYFEVSIKIKNISFNPMNLIIQIKDDENKDAPVGTLSKNKNIEKVPSILSQTKIEHFGLIDCGDERIFSLKFLPLIKGYCYLPNLTLIDIYSERKFYIVQTNKIFIEENIKNN